MNDPRLNYANEYPVEILPPDISGYKKTNTGVDYILTLDSGFPGPHVLVTAVVPVSYTHLTLPTSFLV